MREKQLALEAQRPAIDAGDVRRRRRDRNAEIALDQMLGEGRGMRRAAARAGDDDLRRSASEPRHQFGEGRGQLPRLRRTAVGASASSLAIPPLGGLRFDDPILMWQSRDFGQR